MKYKMLFVLAVFAMGLLADELVLVNGTRYKGNISRNAKGQIEVATSKGTFAFEDEKVNFKQTKINNPDNLSDFQNALKKKDFSKISTIANAWGKKYQGMPVRWNEMAIYGKTLVAENAKDSDTVNKLIEEYNRYFPTGSYKGEMDVLKLTLNASTMDRKELKKNYADILSNKSGSEAANARMHLALAKLCLEDGEATPALENFASVVVLYGDIPDLENEALFGCGEAYKALNDKPKALFYYRQLTEKDNPFKAQAEARLKELEK